MFCGWPAFLRCFCAAVIAFSGTARTTTGPPPSTVRVRAAAASGSGVVVLTNAGLFILRKGRPPRSLPIEGRVVDLASGDGRVWVLRARPESSEIVGITATGESEGSIRLGPFPAAEIAFAAHMLWVGSWVEKDEIQIRTFRPNGAAGPRWTIPLDGEAPLDALEESILDRSPAAEAGLVLGGYELAAAGDGVALVFRRRNLLVLLSPTGGAPRAVRWPSVARAIQALGRGERRGRAATFLHPVPHIAAVAGLGGCGMLVVEPWLESDVEAAREFLRSGGTVRRPKGARATLSWLSIDGTVLERSVLPIRPSTILTDGVRPVAVPDAETVVPLPLGRVLSRCLAERSDR